MWRAEFPDKVGKFLRTRFELCISMNNNKTKKIKVTHHASVVYRNAMISQKHDMTLLLGLGHLEEPFAIHYQLVPLRRHLWFLCGGVQGLEPRQPRRWVIDGAVHRLGLLGGGLPVAPEAQYRLFHRDA